MKEEYTRETYPSIGKRYNNEKAIISLTSWKARINTVSKTLFSLIKMCPGFHIVLCLSEEEFPLMEKELPKDLMLFVNNNLVEILWVYKNYKAFKKVLFTMDKYRDVPVISADDDCLYTCNYAQELYTAWVKNNKVYSFVRYTPRKTYITQGPCTLYFIKPNDIILLINNLSTNIIVKSLDDDYYSAQYKKLGYSNLSTVHTEYPFIFHDDVSPLTANQRNSAVYKKCFFN